MKRYLVVLGTRPEAIKLCPLILALRRMAGVEVRLLFTGQHRDMARPVLDFFGVRADVDLGVMQAGQSVQTLTERLLREIARTLSVHESPDAVLAHGDTATAFAAALPIMGGDLICGGALPLTGSFRTVYAPCI